VTVILHTLLWLGIVAGICVVAYWLFALVMLAFLGLQVLRIGADIIKRHWL
jgi:hypothetical protein